MKEATILLLVGMVALSGCLGDDDGNPDGGDMDDGMGGDGGDGNMTAPPTYASATVTAEGLFPLTLGPLAVRLEPATLTVTRNTVLNITYTNNDVNVLIGHDLKLDGVDAQTPVLDPGESAMISFLVDLEPGEYPYYCAVGDHRAMGMEGTLIVTA